ncbi:4Fe-4S binding protein [Desulfuromonas carbonis]|uniref:ATP-binding protein n=1 Tax=Desulfuromonas sp. DDH964 TaxID=1823759 RepID=UPI00078E86FE|nr:4Fe-4S binding protein [Desulfuromonas sp. DDH964]AMV72030.1 iron-sulfur cluster-binding oxidoreductase [Desulfuromonas sp. DDH964]
MQRDIVRIDEEKCNGCGLCVPACAEGAIRIIDGKAKLIADNLCDGLGACLGHCPQDAIIVEKRQAEAFDEGAVEKHLAASSHPPTSHPAPATGGCPSAQVRVMPAAGGCPSAQVRQLAPATGGGATTAPARSSELRQWPVQMHLVPPTAPFLQDAELVLAADCAPFAYADFHRDLLQGKALLIGCPKLDDGQAYLDKLTAILRQNQVRSLTVVHMEVPCCSGLIALARRALEASGSSTPLHTVKVTIGGELA